MSVSYRYFRLKTISGLNGYLEISEFLVGNSGARVNGATITSSVAPGYGSVNDLNDNSTLTYCWFSAADAQSESFWIQLDFGSPVTATGFYLAAYTVSDRYPTACVVEGSNDGSAWLQLANPTGMPWPGNRGYSSEFVFAAPAVTLSSTATATATATGDLKAGFIGQPTRGTLTITGHTPGFINAALGSAAAANATASAGLTVGFIGQPTRCTKTVSGHTPGFINRVLQSIADNWLNTQYRCYLTGSADAVADVELPIKSFQVRQNSSYTYLSVVVPGVDVYQSAITARPNGSIKIQRIYNYADGSSQTFDVISAAFSSLRIDSGGASGMTGTLTGTGTPPVATTQTVDLYDPTYYSSTNGIDRRYRCRLDPRLRPGDTANINGEAFTVAEIIQYADINTCVMEIAE